MEPTPETPVFLAYFLAIALILIIGYFSLKTMEFLYVMAFKRPLYVHFYFKMRRIAKSEEKFLQENFPFYNKLTQKQQRFFQHRLVGFIDDKDFEGRGEMEITQEVKLLIAATAVMLTFGMRNFHLGILQKIIVYPNAFYSNTSAREHKGEFNPLMKVLVLSWEDFQEGFVDEKDNLNLGIHEFTHVLQMNSKKFRSVDASIFLDANQQLEDFLKEEKVRKKLLSTNYFRNYAYTNQFEFLAVLVEYFIESPKDFQEKFPEFYFKIREMLNFNFAGY